MSLELNSRPTVTGYLLLFRNTAWMEDGLSDAEVMEGMDKVRAWFDRLSASGKIVSAQPLFDDAVRIAGKGGRSVTDGPYAEAKEAIGGYVLISAESMEEAVAIAQSNPLHDYGLVTEVRATASGCPHFDVFLRRQEEAVGAGV